MFGSNSLLESLLADPLALYPALAALLLAAVSLASGLLRGDVLSLTRPLPMAWVVLAVAACWGMQRALERLAPAGWEAAPTVAFAPLALIALAYGPTPALVALALAAAWVGLPATAVGSASDARVLVLGLELVVLGWLAIAPSPRRWPIVAGAYLLLAHLLAWSTAGLAWAVLVSGEATLDALRDQHGFGFAALAAVMLLLAIVPPASWRALFPGSWIAPPPPAPAHSAAAASDAAAGGADPAGDLAPWARRRSHHTAVDLAQIDPPEPFARRRRTRARRVHEPERRR